MVKQIAPECDLVLVVGSRNSSNSVRLVEVALEAGARASYLVDFAHEVDETWLDGVGTVGVTSGASVPEELVEGLLDWLAERGFGDVEDYTAAKRDADLLAAQGAAPGPAGTSDSDQRSRPPADRG